MFSYKFSCTVFWVFKAGVNTLSQEVAIGDELVSSKNIQVTTSSALMLSLNPQRSYRIKILKISQTGELFFVYVLKNLFQRWWIIPKVFGSWNREYLSCIYFDCICLEIEHNITSEIFWPKIIFLYTCVYWQ